MCLAIRVPSRKSPAAWLNTAPGVRTSPCASCDGDDAPWPADAVPNGRHPPDLELHTQTTDAMVVSPLSERSPRGRKPWSASAPFMTRSSAGWGRRSNALRLVPAGCRESGMRSESLTLSVRLLRESVTVRSAARRVRSDVGRRRPGAAAASASDSVIPAAPAAGAVTKRRPVPVRGAPALTGLSLINARHASESAS